MEFTEVIRNRYSCKKFDARQVEEEKLQARLIMQVHDELIVECPEAEAPQVEVLLAEEMRAVMDLAVPLIAEAHSGKNWLEAKG